MEGHFTLVGSIAGDPNWQKFISAAIPAGAILALGLLTRRLQTAEERQQAVIPAEKASLFGFVDFVVESFVSFHDSILGKDNRKYASFSAALFFFILFSNLLGLFPFQAAITTTVWINVGMSLLVFVYFNAVGIKTNGWAAHFKHYCGPLWWMAPFLFPLEIFSAFLRIVTLNLRLYWNINADHMVLGIFTESFYLVGAPFYALGVFVCFMQAFIFTTLTMVYILLAVQHD